MNFKKKSHKHTTWRKELNPICSIGEWSRMLHLWWKREAVSKKEFKQQQQQF